MTTTTRAIERFLRAQDGNATAGYGGDTYATALKELGEGRKRSHWMWYVFPQASGLGHTPISRHYAIGNVSEAVAYLEHPVLGPRYLESVEILATCLVTGPPQDVWVSLQSVLGRTDAMKFKSSLTLFGETARTLFGNVADGVAKLSSQLHGLGLRRCSTTLEWMSANP